MDRVGEDISVNNLCDHILTVFREKLEVLNVNTRCRRLGKKPPPRWVTAPKPRSVIIEFYSYSDRSKVWGSKSKLLESSYFVLEDLPFTLRNNRQKLLPSYLNAKCAIPGKGKVR